MADQAQRPDVRQVASASTFRDRENVVGIPKGPSADCLQTPALERAQAPHATTPFQRKERRHRIGPALRADPFIPRESPFAQESRIGAQAPFFHAELRAERQPPLGHFQFAPAAKIAAFGALRQFRAADVAAFQRTWFQKIRIR